ncbi:MAG: hypothetical protein KBH23_05385 [Bacteroidaceae bacterium]|nr:hypothetical protein [Bacteroidaceae bacterium]
MKFLLRNVLIVFILCGFCNAAYGESWQLVTSVSDLTDGEYLLTNVGGTRAFSSVPLKGYYGLTCPIFDTNGDGKIDSYSGAQILQFIKKAGTSEKTFSISDSEKIKYLYSSNAGSGGFRFDSKKGIFYWTFYDSSEIGKGLFMMGKVDSKKDYDVELGYSDPKFGTYTPKSSYCELICLYKKVITPDPSFTFDTTYVTVRFGDTFTPPTLVNGFASIPTYTSSESGIATVTSDGKVTLVAPGATTITASIAATDLYPAAKASYDLLVTDGASLYAVRFEERFSRCKDTGGNDETWTGSNGSGVITFDNLGWTMPQVSNTACIACECIKLASASDGTKDSGNDGSVTTPALFDAKDALLTFRAGTWKGESSSFTITISEGERTLSTATVRLLDAAFKTFQIKIKNLTANSKITFSTPAGHRVFLDDVVVSELIAPEKVTENDVITLSGNWKQTEISALDLPDLPSGKTIDVSNLAIDGVLPLRDNYGLISTEDRTNAVSYIRNFSGKVLVNGNVSWDIICLPYTVKSVTSNGIAYVPYSVWDRVKNANDGFFYLKKVETGTNNITVDATSIEANTPYIIAFPKLMIPGYDQFYVGDDITFTFLGDTLKSTVYTPGIAMKSWTFVPNYKQKTLSSNDNVYTLNADGTQFVSAVEKTIANPYRPYLVWASSNTDSAPKAYFLNGEVTAIDPVFMDKEINEITATSPRTGAMILQATRNSVAIVYSLSGSVIARLSMKEGENSELKLPSGVYFVNKQKVIVE